MPRGVRSRQLHGLSGSRSYPLPSGRPLLTPWPTRLGGKSLSDCLSDRFHQGTEIAVDQFVARVIAIK